MYAVRAVPFVASMMTTMAWADAGSGIVKASAAGRPEGLNALWRAGGLNALWRAGGWALGDAAVVDARHLVLVFFVDHWSRFAGACVPGQLTKFTDNVGHAPYRAECLKLATLRHYRNQHQDLEGTWDPTEGRSRIASSLEAMCRRHGLQSLAHGALGVETEVNYQTDDASLIYCTSRSTVCLSRYAQWKVASRIHDVGKFALSLGGEFARQRDDGRHAQVTGLDWLVYAACENSGTCERPCGAFLQAQEVRGSEGVPLCLLRAGRSSHRGRVLSESYLRAALGFREAVMIPDINGRLSQGSGVSRGLLLCGQAGSRDSGP